VKWTACASPGMTTRRPRGSNAVACSAHAAPTNPSRPPRTTTVGCSSSGRRSSIRSANTERAVASSARIPTAALSRAATASSDKGSHAESLRAANAWWRARRLAGSTVGPMRTIGPTRCGSRTASSVTIWQPIEFATKSGRIRPDASSHAPSASASSEMSPAARGGSLFPCPGRSGTKAAQPSASARASGSMYVPETP
jgi:hypothetical protein